MITVSEGELIVFAFREKDYLSWKRCLTALIHLTREPRVDAIHRIRKIWIGVVRGIANRRSTRADKYRPASGHGDLIRGVQVLQWRLIDVVGEDIVPSAQVDTGVDVG